MSEAALREKLDELQQQEDREALAEFRAFLVDFQTRRRRRVVARPVIVGGMIDAEIIIVRDSA